jgi:hypothetical protein
MGQKKSSSKLKEVLVDEEVSLSVIENWEFVAMRAAEKLCRFRLQQRISSMIWSATA